MPVEPAVRGSRGSVGPPSGAGEAPTSTAVGWLLLTAILLLSAGAGPAGAQEEKTPDDEEVITAEGEFEDIELLELEVPVVVTASRREQKITAVPYAISIVTAEDIRRAGARSIPDALRLVPGVDVAELAFGNAAVQPRGLHGLLSREVLVLVDGRQVYDSLFGGASWGSLPFQLEDIKRIEVIRGPAGVTWGANAVNGVINIITKDPAEQIGLTFTAGGGSRGTHKEHLGYAFQEGKLRLRVSGEFEGSDGFREGGSFLRDLDDHYEAGRMAIHGIYEPGPKDVVTFSAGSGLLNGGYPPTPMAGFGLRRDSESQASFLMGNWAHQISTDNRFEVNAYVNDFFASPGVPAIDYRYQQFALQFGHSFKPLDAHTVTWGIDTRADILDATNSDPFLLSKDFVSTAIIGVYVQEQWRFAPKWTLNLGARIDYEFYGGFQPSARAALSYQLDDNSSLYGAVSRAFQMPPVGARFVSTPLLNGLVRLTADRDVDPEVLMAYEVGYRGRLFERLETNLSVFWHEYDDNTVLRPRLGPPGLVRMHFENAASSSLYGVELDLSYAVTDELRLLGNYTYQQLNWHGPAPFNQTDLISPPEHKFMIGARYSPTGDLHLSGHLYYVDEVEAPNPGNPFAFRDVEPYFRLDLRAEYEFWNDNASIGVGVRNLLDSGHYEGSSGFLNDAEVPRMVYAEFRLAVK